MVKLRSFQLITSAMIVFFFYFNGQRGSGQQNPVDHAS
jgi:hypothetical protein